MTKPVRYRHNVFTVGICYEDSINNQRVDAVPVVSFLEELKAKRFKKRLLDSLVSTKTQRKELEDNTKAIMLFGDNCEEYHDEADLLDSEGVHVATSLTRQGICCGLSIQETLLVV